MKNKTTAGIFALLFGHLGIHRFYLGERKLGKFYLLGTFFLFFLSVKMNAPIVLAMLILSFIDGVLLLSMGREEFNEKYNQRYLNRPAHQPENAARQPAKRQATATETPNPYKATGLQKFKDFDYEEALEDFKKSLAIKFDDPAVHFNVACCYSLNERPDPAFFHLSKAVHFGFIDFDKIEKHEALAYLRTQPAFRDFVKNGYQFNAAQPEPQPDLLAQKPIDQASLLDQIKRLSELREQGILTEEEYNGMKEEVLRR